MSFRELRNFCEMMRALGYSRLVSMENFRKPNFELVAEMLYWLAKRYDPKAEISDNIEDETNRVEFIKSIASLFASKARIKLNTKKLYQADGYAVQELLKIASILYKAYAAKGLDEEESLEFSLPSKLQDLKGLKTLATEITDSGAKLFDLLNKETELREHREKAILFLENISRNLESNTEQQYIEKCVGEIIQQQVDNISEMKKYAQNAEKDSKTLEEKIKKKKLDLDRSETRLKALTNVKPAFMDEYERLEKELEKLYNEYIEKFRNLDYLEHQLDVYNKQEEEKCLDSQKVLEKIRKNLQENELKILRGEQEIDQSALDQQIKEDREDVLKSRGQSRGDSRGEGDNKFNKPVSNNMFKKPPAGKNAPPPQSKTNPKVQGSLLEPEDDEEEDDQDLNDEDEDLDLEGEEDEEEESEEEKGGKRRNDSDDERF